MCYEKQCQIGYPDLWNFENRDSEIGYPDLWNFETLEAIRF